MAVLVMEMVPAECAGLILTCNPVTGDPSTIYIASKREVNSKSKAIALFTLRVTEKVRLFGGKNIYIRTHLFFN